MPLRQPAHRRRPEQQVQRALFEHLRWRGSNKAFAFHVPNGGARSGVESAILQGLGVVGGVPDVLVVSRGRLYALELKAPGGRLSPVQKSVHEAMRAAGAEVATAVGLDDALHRLEAWNLLVGRVS
jgi:hypothetical protein